MNIRVSLGREARKFILGKTDKNTIIKECDGSEE